MQVEKFHEIVYKPLSTLEAKYKQIIITQPKTIQDDKIISL